MNNISVEPVNESVIVSVSAPQNSVSVSFPPTENAQVYSELAKKYCDDAAHFSENAVTIIKNTVDNIESGLVNSINAVADDLTNIDAVNENKTNIDTVVSNLSGINTISANLTNINAVNSNKTNIDTLATNMINVNTVLSNITNINTVAENISAVTDFNTEIDRIDQSKGKESGSVSTNADILADIKKYAHSTFDESKFTKSASWSGTITHDGIASGFSTSSYCSCTTNLSNSTNYEINFSFMVKSFTGNAQYILWEASNAFLLVVRADNTLRFSIHTSSGFEAVTTSQALVTDVEYYGKMSLINNSKIELYLGTSVDNIIKVDEINLTGTPYPPSNTLITGGNKADRDFSGGLLDLRYLSIINDSVPVFSGNKTGTDTYTINGNTVDIPYVWSKTGSKIVDSEYRSQVTAVYNEFGYAPYYTLSDTDFTLPMGEVYGMIGSKTLRSNYRNGVDYWEIYSDNTLEQGGICTSGTEVTLLKSYKDTNYILTVPYSAKTTTTFTPSQSGCWIAKGVY